MSSSLGSSQASSAPTRVLVVDDDAAGRQAVYERLNRPGRRCRQAASIREALTLAGAEPFDVAVMGAQVSADCSVALRQHDPEIGLVMLSDRYSFQAATAAMQVGAAGLIVQPCSDAELQAAVESGLRWRRAAHATRTALDTWRRDIVNRTEKVAAAFATLDVISPPTIEAQFKALAANGRELFEHGARTAATAAAIAEGMRCDDNDAVVIAWAALLHDIGKLALPAALLNKPGALSDAETAIVRTHTRIGADILRRVPAFVPAADMVLASHERYDGRGYPRGLRAAGIPLGARIIMVADTIDVMVYGRTYREPVSSAEAAAEIVRGAGTQFDPDVVNEWLRVAERSGVAV